MRNGNWLIAMAMISGFETVAQERDFARSMVMTQRGIVATSQTLASQAGAAILARGGSAVDAAIAANAALNVVEPMMNGMGGDLFAIVREARNGARHGLNASGPAPRGLTAERLRGEGNKTMPPYGVHTVTVPGCVAGWGELHRKFGKLPWADLFAPAIFYAENGYPVTELIAADWNSQTRKLSQDAYGAGVFLPGGKAPAAGQIYRNRDLAKALREVAAKGPEAFYKGEIAAAILKKTGGMHGTLAASDLESFRPEWVAPLVTNYRGWNVYELPPGSQGVAALEMLNIMERFDLGKLAHKSAEALHIKIEAQKLAYQDLRRYVADPAFARVPVEALVSKEYARERAALIDLGRARCEVQPGKPALAGAGDTVYLAAVDSEGNMISLIQSIFQSFGSGIAVDGYGFHLHNRGALFTLEEGHPNVLAPGKRPFHTIIPALMERDSRAIAFGIMGGLNQAQAHAQFVSNMVDHGMNMQAALEAPRFYKSDFGGCNFGIEGRYPEASIEALRKLGHAPKVVGAYASDMGGGQAVEFNAQTGVKMGASSPRKDGAAIPEPDRYFR